MRRSTSRASAHLLTLASMQLVPSPEMAGPSLVPHVFAYHHLKSDSPPTAPSQTWMLALLPTPHTFSPEEPNPPPSSLPCLSLSGSIGANPNESWSALKAATADSSNSSLSASGPTVSVARETRERSHLRSLLLLRSCVLLFARLSFDQRNSLCLTRSQ